MIIFFDTNILLDLALERAPHTARCEKVFSDAIQNHLCYIAWHSISNMSYIIGNKKNADSAQTFIQEIFKVCKIAPVSHSDLQVAFDHNSGDLEDAMQIASAMAVNADVIVTRDPKGFRKSPIQLINPTLSP